MSKGSRRRGLSRAIAGFRTFLVAPVVAGLMTSCGWSSTVSRASLESSLFALTQTTSIDEHRFWGHIRGCATETRAFAELMQQLVAEPGLPAHASDDNEPLFGGSYDAESRQPFFVLDLREIELLPTARDLKAWAPDSSWGFSRCEIIAHELEEAITYRRSWDARDTAVVRSEPGAWTRLIQRPAHAAALRAENAVAAEIGVRVDSAGAQFFRSVSCNRDYAFHFMFGVHTQSFRLDENQNVSHISYESGRPPRCGPRTADAPEGRPGSSP